MIYVGILSAFFFLFALGCVISDYIAPAMCRWFVNWRHNSDRKTYGRCARR